MNNLADREPGHRTFFTPDEASIHFHLAEDEAILRAGELNAQASPPQFGPQDG